MWSFLLKSLEGKENLSLSKTFYIPWAFYTIRRGTNIRYNFDLDAEPIRTSAAMVQGHLSVQFYNYIKHFKKSGIA